MRWHYVANDNERKGPIKETEFIKLFQDDTITRDTLVWNGKTVQDWCKISAIDGIENELKNWKPGCGRLLKSLETTGKKKTKTNVPQKVDVLDVEEKPSTQVSAKGQQVQTSQAVQTTEDEVFKMDGSQKVVKVEDDSPVKGNKTNETEALKTIIHTNAVKVEEKYSDCMENLQSKVSDLESRLSKKVEEVEVLKEKMQVTKVETNNRLKVLAKEKEELEILVKAQEDKEPSVPSEQTKMKNLEEELRSKIRALEDSSGKSAADWDKLSKENDSLQMKNIALTEENRTHKDKMNSRITELESQLSKAVNESNVAKEDLQTQSESKVDEAKLEKEQNILQEKVKALNEEKTKFEKYKREELMRMKSYGHVDGTSKMTGRVDGAKERSSILFRWRWTLLSIGLMSVVGYKMLTRAAEPEPKVPTSLYSTAGEKGKKLSETITNKVTNTISNRIPDIPSIPNIPNVFKK